MHYIHSWLTTICFIRFILAVCVSIALPVHVNTLPAPTLELAHRAARFLRLRPPAAALHGLVWLVLAVRVAVATPQGGDALWVIAAELVLAAGGSRALLLVAGVPAVVVAITDEDWCHTLPVTALEIFGGASLSIYVTKGAGGKRKLTFWAAMFFLILLSLSIRCDLP